MRIFTTDAVIHHSYVITNNIQNSDPHLYTRYDYEGAPIRMNVGEAPVVPEEVRTVVLNKFHQPEGAEPNEELLECWRTAITGRRAAWGLMRVRLHYGRMFLEFVKNRKPGMMLPEGRKYTDTLMITAGDFGPDEKPVHFEFITRLIDPFGESHTHVYFGPHTTSVTEIGDASYRTLNFSLPSAQEAQTERYPVEVIERTW